MPATRAPPKNNLASKKCYDEKKMKAIAKPFEYYCVYQLNQKNEEINYHHWDRVPHDWLYDSGYITDFNKFRLNKLKQIKNVLHTNIPFSSKSLCIFNANSAAKYIGTLLYCI